MTSYVAAIDQGTTSTRCLIFDRQGGVVAARQEEHRQITPRPGWVEHDPIEILERTLEVAAGAMQDGGLGPAQLAAIGITNQRETTVLWERATGRPVANAVVWQDTRTGEMVTALARHGGIDRFRARTGLPLATYFSAPKLVWLLEHVPGARVRAERGELLFGTIDSWLIWNLTGGPHGGVHVTDVTNASRTMLFSLLTLDWDPELLDAFGVPRQLLPQVRPSSAIYGTATGALTGVPIAGALGDQQAALVGQRCLAPGEAKNTYGTGCFLLVNTGRQPIASRHGLLTTVAYQFGDAPAVFGLEGSVAIAGALVQWLRDGLGLITRAAEIEQLAAADNGGVYIVPAFSGLFAPYWRSDARGVIVGLTRFADKRHLARAALEATAYQTREVLEAMVADIGTPLTRLAVDGGMVGNHLPMPFQADILGLPIERPEMPEATALGAAFAAGLAVDFWSSPAQLPTAQVSGRRWNPTMDANHRDRLFRDWKRAVERSFDWVESSGGADEVEAGV